MYVKNSLIHEKFYLMQKLIFVFLLLIGYTINVFGTTPLLSIGNWRFDECTWKGSSGEVKDSSGSSYNATAKSANNTSLPQLSEQIINNSALFSRAHQNYIELPTLIQNQPNFNDSFSVTVWAKFSASAGYWERIFDIGNGTNINNIFLGRQDTSNNLVLGIHDPGTSQYLVANGAISDTNWHFWGATCNGSGGCKLYKDGVKIAESTTMKIPANVARTKNYIGKSNWSADAYLEGGVDELKFFDATLSDSEILSIYNNETIKNNYDGTTRESAHCPPSLSTCWVEDFTNPFIKDNWRIIKSTNYIPQVVNTNGNNKLMLTNDTKGIATGVNLNGYLPASNNYLEIEFENNAYGGYIGADGTALILSDANIYAIAGSSGGSLGYAGTTNTNGFTGGWLGFGFDEYGNFAVPGNVKEGGISKTLDAVTIRGTGNGMSGYTYITTSGTLTPGIDETSSTSSAPGDRYKLTIDTRNNKTWVNVQRDHTAKDGSAYATIIDWTDATQNASSPENFQLSLTASTGDKTNFHSVDNFSLKALNCGTVGATIEQSNVTFDAWDTFRSMSDRNISTKIVNKPFNLTVASLTPENNELHDINGTVCVQLINSSNNATLARQCHRWINQQNDSTYSFTIAQAIKDINVKLSWIKNDTSGTFADGREEDSTIASDHFAVRPASFSIIASNAVAGVDFDINFTAPNISGNVSSDYNESAGSSFRVTALEHNSSCTQGVFSSQPTSFSFVNGTKTVTTKYSEVGLIDINISDLTIACESRFAGIDCDDANVNDGTNFTAVLLAIGQTQKQITITPERFDVNATLFNFSGGGFTYLSSDLEMSAQLDIKLTAKNAEGNTTKNYTSGCYSNDTTLTLEHSIVPSPLTKILYHDSVTLSDLNITKSIPMTSAYAASKFTQGVVTSQITFNFDRSYSSPVNPFDFSITSATATDSKISGSSTPLGTAQFVYGRIHAYDITTNVSPVLNPIEFEIYSTTSGGYVIGMPQNVLHWYRNIEHSSGAQGTIIQGGFSSGSSTLDTSLQPYVGIQNVSITSTSDKTLHLDVSPWLWYSNKYNYNYASGSDCTKHPCFNYHYTNTPNSLPQGVHSGTFKGSDFTIAPAKKITNKGVKLFR